MKRALFGFFGFVLAAACLFARPALAEDYVDKILTGKAAERALNILRNLAWIPDGKDTGRHVYVLFTSTCEYCKKLFEAARNKADDIQYRWILCDPQGEAGSLLEKPDMDSIRMLFTTGELPDGVNESRTARMNEATMNGILFLLMQGALTDDSSRFGFPTLIYGDGNSLSIIIGMPVNLGDALKNVPQGKVDEKTVPAAFRFADKDVEFISVGDMEYENTHQEEVPMRLMPFKDAPHVGGIKPGKLSGLPVTGVSREGFVHIFIDNSEPRLYIEDPVFVKKALAGKE